MIKDQQYNIKTTTTSKDNEKLVIIELTWIGTLSIDVAPWNIKSGDKLTAEICCLIEFGDDDLIINQKNYDCYYDPKATTEKK